jgi:DNA-binding FadR family transcriptional regulator
VPTAKSGKSSVRQATSAPHAKAVNLIADTGRGGKVGLHSLITNTIGRYIVGGTYAEHQFLPRDTDLMAQFGVSRTVLRESLKTLSAKGLIVARAKVGTRVREREAWNFFDPDVLRWQFETGPDLRFLASLAEVRQAIEPEAAALATERRTDQQVAAMLGWVAKMAQPGNTAEEFALYDLEFHRVVAEASDNPFMRSISAVVEVALTAAFTISSPVAEPVAFKRTVGIHADIAIAIRDRNRDKAREAMRAAIREGYERASRSSKERS